MKRPWLDQQKSVEERARLLLGAMSLNDKLAMMHGGVPSPELGVPPIKLSDGPGGVTSGEGASIAGTQMPAPISLSATFSPEASRKYGTVLGEESADRGITILLAPTVNIARSALNGRNFESFGEDPYLAGALAAQFVRGVQEQGVIANVKHYAANNQETDRFTQNSIIDERTLREIYLPAFEAAVKEGQAGSVMASYNKINGVAGTENRELLTHILKNNWGFEGFIISDFLATQSTVGALLSGLDYELTLPFRRYFGEPLKQAVENGQVPIEKIDEATGRILRTLFQFGHFDERPPASNTALYHPEEALRTALESIVLLKNEEGILPLNKKKRIAVIGQAASLRMIASGGGSAHVRSDSVVSPLEGISSLAGDTEICYTPGTAPIPVGPKFMYGSPNEDLIVPVEAFEDGLVAEYYTTNDLSGEPEHKEVIANLDMVWPFGSPLPRSAKWMGRLKPGLTSLHTFYLPSSGGSRLYVNRELVIDNWAGQELYSSGEAMLEAGKLAEIEIHFTSDGAPQALPCLSLHWHSSTDADEIAKAVQAARESDAAIVFVNDFMTENYDKPSLSLPGAQDRLVDAVIAANPNTIVVLNTGGPVLMPWVNRAKAVLQLWYPGQEGGNAIASVLFGEHDASGRLPVTFPASEHQMPVSAPGQFPGIGLDSIYSEGLEIGYRWYDANEVKPLFPFGHGLSYTTFVYENLVLEQQGDTVRVEFHIRNTGNTTGSAVPQLYMSFPEGSGEPPKQLKAFTKVEINAGDSSEVVFELDRRAFSIWCIKTDRWVLPGGAFTILIGRSSQDIVLNKTLKLHGMDQPREGYA